MRLLTAGVLLCLSFAAFGANRTVSWTHPTTNSDGSALPVTAITRTVVVWGASAGALTNSRIVTGPATSTVIDFPIGTHFVAARTTANGNDSALSNVVQIIIPAPTPNPPVLTVQEVVAGVTESPAYRILASGARGSTVIGFVSKGTACSGPKVFSYRDRTYHRVPKASVKWWGTTATDEVAAACG